jgi:hypothetical protein
LPLKAIFYGHKPSVADIPVEADEIQSHHQSSKRAKQTASLWKKPSVTPQELLSGSQIKLPTLPEVQVDRNLCETTSIGCSLRHSLLKT